MKILTIFGFIVFISFQSFGQKVIDNGTVLKDFDELINPTLPDFEKFSIEKNGGLSRITETSVYARADPWMPIAFPPKDLNSKFPIKAITKDFPSNMPVLKFEKGFSGEN